MKTTYCDNIKESRRKQFIHWSHILWESVEDSSNRIRVKESAWSSEYSAKHCVMKLDRGLVANQEEMNSSDHGRHNEAQHNGRVDSQIVEMLLKVFIFLKEIPDKGGVVSSSNTWCWKIIIVIKARICFQNYFEFLLAGPVAKPDVRPRVQCLASKIHHNQEDQGEPAASTGKVLGVDWGFNRSRA